MVRILFLPVIAGISYEITVKWAGTHPDNPLVKVVLWPGMQMQYLTTREPDDDQIECAIAAMKLVLAREEAESAKTEDAKAEDGCCQRLMLGRCQAGREAAWPLGSKWLIGHGFSRWVRRRGFLFRHLLFKDRRRKIHPNRTSMPVCFPRKSCMLSTACLRRARLRRECARVVDPRTR